MSYLISRATIEQSWPWTVDYVQSGDMERSFLRHLLDVDPHLSDNKDKLIVMQVSNIHMLRKYHNFPVFLWIYTEQFQYSL